MARVLPRPITETPASTSAPEAAPMPTKRGRGRPRRNPPEGNPPTTTAVATPDPSNLYEVIRPIKRGPSDDDVVQIGTILDASKWPAGRAKALVNQRFLKVAGS